MVCCSAQIVCYSLPGDCGTPVQRGVAPPYMDIPVLARNDSGFSINSGNDAGIVPGAQLPTLGNGVISGAFTAEQQAFLVLCGGVQNWSDTIQIDVDMMVGGDPTRRMVGFGYWNGYGSLLNDGDGIGDIHIHLFDQADALIGVQVLPDANNAAIHPAAFSFGAVQDVRRFELHLGRKPFAGSNHANLREIAPIWAYRSAIDWTCFGRTVTAQVDYDGNDVTSLVTENNTSHGATIVAGSGLTITPTQLTQTRGPHRMTFTSDGPFQGTINTNAPGNFSSLSISDVNPTVIVTGNATVNFDIDWTFPGVQGAAIRSAVSANGELRDLATGALVNPATVNVVPCT